MEKLIDNMSMTIRGDMKGITLFTGRFSMLVAKDPGFRKDVNADDAWAWEQLQKQCAAAWETYCEYVKKSSS